MLPEGVIRHTAAILGGRRRRAVADRARFRRACGSSRCTRTPASPLRSACRSGSPTLRFRSRSDSSRCGSCGIRPTSWAGRALAALGIAAGVLLWQRPELLLRRAGLAGHRGAHSCAAICGMPIFGLLGGCAVFLFLAQGDSPANAVIGSYDQLTSEGLAAIPLVHARRIPAGRRPRLGPPAAPVPRVLRMDAGRHRDRDGDAVRVLHGVHRRIGRHDPRARRTAAAGIARRRLPPERFRSAC